MHATDKAPRGVWHDTEGRRTAHLAGHLVQLQQIDERTLEVCIDGYSRRWTARGKDPLHEAQRAIVSLLRASRRG